LKAEVLKVKNVAKLIVAGESLTSRAHDTPGMGLIFGPTGVGKTTATTWYVNKCHGVYVRAMSLWSPSSMMKTISRELDIAPVRSLSDMAENIAFKLADTGRPLFIDEADYVIDQKRMVEALRDLHDLSTVPVILIGMAGIQRKIQQRKQVSGRLAQWVEFTPCDLDDVHMLASGRCEIDVADDLLQSLHHKTHGLARNVIVGVGAK